MSARAEGTPAEGTPAEGTPAEGTPAEGTEAQRKRLFFLPGASGNRQFWRPVGEQLTHLGQAHYFGWPGFGGLEPDASVNGIDDLVRCVVHEMTGPVALLAQSMGGIIAMRAALERPQWVQQIVLSVTSGGVDMTALNAYDWRREFRRNNPHLPRWFEDERPDLSSQLSAITVPVLLLWGDADPISPVPVGQRLLELLPNAKLVIIPGGTHDLISERANDVLPHIERHLVVAES